MALACKPKLIIADEATTALDVIVQDQILEEIKLLQRTSHISLLFISHDISIVADVCHDIGIMYAGKLVEYGPTGDVFQSPLHPYTKVLLESFPTLTGDKSLLASVPGETPNLMISQMGCRFYDRCKIAENTCNTREPVWTNASPVHKALCFKCV